MVQVCEEAAEVLRREAVAWTIPHSKESNPPLKSNHRHRATQPQSAKGPFREPQRRPPLRDADEEPERTVGLGQDQADICERDVSQRELTEPVTAQDPQTTDRFGGSDGLRRDREREYSWGHQEQGSSWESGDPALDLSDGDEPSNIRAEESYQSENAYNETEFNYSILVPSSLAPGAVYQDTQAVRAVTFDSSGELFLLGSNSKALVVCSTESESDGAVRVLEQRAEHHFGSIYTVAWRDDLIASGSNDKLVRVLRYPYYYESHLLC